MNLFFLTSAILCSNNLTFITLTKLSFPDSPQHSSQSVLEENERIFTELMQALERRYTDVKEMIRAQETLLLTQAERHLSRMEEEITLLKMKHNDLERLSHSEDHIHFLQVWVPTYQSENMLAHFFVL